jgi:hypothetical protein
MMEARLVQEENPDNAEQPFADADGQYARLKQRLDSLEVLGMEHSALEKVIEREGVELMRLLYQGHLLLRAMSEVDVRERGPLVGSDGIERRHRRADTGRGLMTPFGRVSVERAGYSAPGCSSLYPLDAELNLPGDSFSHGVRERVARETAKNSFEDTVETIQRTSGARLGKRQAEKLALEAARDFDEFYATRSHYTPEEQEESGSLLVLSVDGKGVSMRPEGLREATRKKAAKRAKEHGPPSKSRKQARRNSKRMATVAAVYGIEPHVRTPQELMGNLQGVATSAEGRAKRPSPENKRVWASLVESPEQVVGNAFDEALRRDPGQHKRWVALVDGNEPQLDALEHHANQRGIALTIVLDVIHVIGYLWDAARVLGGDSSREQHQWVGERLSGILQGKCVHVAAGMRRSATRRDLSQKQREPVDTCAHYLLKYKGYLRYHEFLAAGLPIATGVIEGACRHLVQDRMGITGARWGLEGAEAILRLRALHISGDFDAYWQFHLQQERLLNHTMLYTTDPPSTRTTPTSRTSTRPILRLVP